MKKFFLLLSLIVLSAPFYSMEKEKDKPPFAGVGPRVVYEHGNFISKCDVCGTSVNPDYIWYLAPCGHQCDTVCMHRAKSRLQCPKCGVKTTASRQDYFYRKLQKEAREAEKTLQERK